MATTLKEQLVLDADLYTNPDEYGELVSYTPKGGVAREIAVQFQLGAVMVGGRMVAVESEGTLLLAKKDVPKPQGGDWLRRTDGTVWKLDLSSVRSADAAFWKLACRIDKIPTFRGV